jgi:hypothetical protein
VRFCDVDLLIAVGGKARVIIEIEESNVKPVHVFGKFFASSFSTHYKPKTETKLVALDDQVLFIQVLDSKALNVDKTGKLDQWNVIESAIQGLPVEFCGRKMKYKLYDGKTCSSLSGSS